jgi:hypothetical protein
MAMNEIRSVLLHQDASEASVRRVHLAHRIAAAHGALLEVLYAVTPALLQYPMATSADSQLAAMLALSDAETRERAKAAFEREVTTAGFDGVLWSEGNDDPVSVFKVHAFASDRHPPAGASAGRLRAHRADRDRQTRHGAAR